MSLSITPELVPIVGGLIIGGIARYASERRYRWLLVTCVLLIALCATIGSGEFRLSWGFLVDDVLFTSLSACAGFMIAGWIARLRLSKEH